MLVRVWLRSDVIRREQSKENKEDDLADENDETKLHTTTIHFDVLSFSCLLYTSDAADES